MACRIVALSALLSIAGGTFLPAPLHSVPLKEAPDRVVVCHKPATKAEKTLEVPPTAAKGHVGHGDRLGACSTAVIGPEGGTAEFPNGITLAVPPGALTESVAIRLTAVSDGTANLIVNDRAHASANKRVLGGFFAEPDGLQFSVPAIVTVQLAPRLAKNHPVLHAEVDLVAGEYSFEPDDLVYDPQTNTVSSKLSSFSTHVWIELEDGWNEPDACMAETIRVTVNAMDYGTRGGCQIVSDFIEVEFLSCPNTPKSRVYVGEATPECGEVKVELVRPAVAVPSCLIEPPEPPAPEDCRLDNLEACPSVSVGASRQLTARILLDGKPLAPENAIVRWESRTPGIASIDTVGGLVTGLAEGGAVIFAHGPTNTAMDSVFISVRGVGEPTHLFTSTPFAVVGVDTVHSGSGEPGVFLVNALLCDQYFNLLSGRDLDWEVGDASKLQLIDDEAIYPPLGRTNRARFLASGSGVTTIRVSDAERHALTRFVTGVGGEPLTVPVFPQPTITPSRVLLRAGESWALEPDLRDPLNQPLDDVEWLSPFPETVLSQSAHGTGVIVTANNPGRGQTIAVAYPDRQRFPFAYLPGAATIEVFDDEVYRIESSTLALTITQEGCSSPATFVPVFADGSATIRISPDPIHPSDASLTDVAAATFRTTLSGLGPGQYSCFFYGLPPITSRPLTGMTDDYFSHDFVLSIVKPGDDPWNQPGKEVRLPLCDGCWSPVGVLQFTRGAVTFEAGTPEVISEITPNITLTWTGRITFVRVPRGQ